MAPVREAEAETFFVVVDGEAMTEDMVLRNVHPHELCFGRACTIHDPSAHHMRGWPLGWWAELKALVRRCPHERWHPDPDQVSYWELSNPLLAEAHYSAHVLSSCDGCCRDTSPLGGDDTGHSTVDNGGD